MFEHFGDCLKLRKHFEIEFLLPIGDTLHRHLQSMLLIERCNDLRHWHTSPGIEEVLIEFALPFSKRPFPCDIMEGHRVGDRAIAIEQVRFKSTYWQA